MKKDIKTFLNLISQCIYLDHPIVLDIRWQFHISLSEIDNFEPWQSREKWEKLIKTYKYTIIDFLTSFFWKQYFRKNIITVLEYEVMDLETRKQIAGEDN